MAKKWVFNGGEVFGNITVIKEVEPIIHNAKKGERRRLLCRCSCGVVKEVFMESLTSSGVTSCGCKRNEETRRRQKKDFAISSHSLYGIFENMKQRCYNPKAINFERYGGKGVDICKEWLSNVRVFYDWAIANGWQKGLDIDRIKNHLGYSPQNCKISTKIENANNKSNNVIVVFRGEEMTLPNACRKLNLNRQKMWSRIINLGYSFEEAVNKFEKHIL